MLQHFEGSYEFRTPNIVIRIQVASVIIRQRSHISFSSRKSFAPVEFCGTTKSILRHEAKRLESQIIEKNKY